MVTLRVACLQFDCKLSQLQSNIAKADAILTEHEPLEIDLLVLPELAFSGYQFKSIEHIAPHLEPTASGPSSIWACETAKRLSCYTVVGYPEECKSPHGETKRYNSCILVAPDGSILTNYRKTHLFETDEIWASEGSGFYAGEIHNSHTTNSPAQEDKLKIALGCCMDLNPLRFKAPYNAFEFGNYIITQHAKIAVMPMAWLSSAGRGADKAIPTPAPERGTMNYWADRLRPLTTQDEDDQERFFIACNRVGKEGDSRYAGSSAVLGLSNGQAVLYGCLGSEEESLLLVDIEL